MNQAIDITTILARASMQQYLLNIYYRSIQTKEVNKASPEVKETPHPPSQEETPKRDEKKQLNLEKGPAPHPQ